MVDARDELVHVTHSGLDPSLRAIAKAHGATVRSAALYLQGAGEPLTRRCSLRRAGNSVRVHWGDAWVSLEGKTQLPGAISIGKPFSVIVQSVGTFEGLPVFGWDRFWEPAHSAVLHHPGAAASLKLLLLASLEPTLVLTKDAVYLTARAHDAPESVTVLIDRFFDTLQVLAER